MTITAYGSIFSIMLFLGLLLPAMFLGICGLKIKWYGLILFFPILLMLAGRDGAYLYAAFIVYEFLLLYSYYHWRETTGGWLYLFTFVASALPLLCVRLAGIYHWKLIFVLSLSYVCFRIWQLIIEIHDGHLENFKFFDILYFITFFPCLTSGPIDRYYCFVDEINTKIDRECYLTDYAAVGLQKIFLGLVYKFGIANLINMYLLTKIPKGLTWLTGVEYMYVYTLYLFFDFAGYSNLAIGAGYILGVKVPENFNYPFLAKNMKEFWERWHISLSKWFGDYLFSRFVLNAIRNKWIISQNGAIRVGYVITMLTMGIWHGFTLYYIVYGLYQGMMLALTDVYLKTKFYRKQFRKPYYPWVSRFVCFHIVAFGMLIFSGYLIRI